MHNGSLAGIENYAYTRTATTCANCGIHIVGHGLEKEGTFFCCEHCAEVKGVIGLRDRIGAGGVIELGSHT